MISLVGRVSVVSKSLGRDSAIEKLGRSLVNTISLGNDDDIRKSAGSEPLKLNVGKLVDTLNESILVGTLILDESSVAMVGSKDEAVTLSL